MEQQQQPTTFATPADPVKQMVQQHGSLAAGMQNANSRYHNLERDMKQDNMEKVVELLLKPDPQIPGQAFAVLVSYDWSVANTAEYINEKVKHQLQQHIKSGEHILKISGCFPDHDSANTYAMQLQGYYDSLGLGVYGVDCVVVPMYHPRRYPLNPQEDSSRHYLHGNDMVAPMMKDWAESRQVYQDDLMGRVHDVMVNKTYKPTIEEYEQQQQQQQQQHQQQAITDGTML